MKKTAVAFLALLGIFGIIQAQNDLDELSKIRKLLRDNVMKEMPAWTNRSVEPIEGSQDVLIEQWESGDIIVKIAVTKYPDEDRAVRGFKDFKSHLTIEEKAQSKRRGKPFHLIKEDLQGIGDEGFVSDTRGSEGVTFRKGKFLVNISVPSPADNTDVFFSRKFANCVTKALDDR